MLRFNQFCRLFLWIHLVISVLCVTGTFQSCSLRSFTQSSSFDENFDVTGLSQSYDPGATVRVPCKPGFRSFYKLICTNTGWEQRGEKCQPIRCGHPGDVSFADFALVQGTDYVFASQVQYTCHPGYHMISATSTRNCLQGGWDGHLPVCEPVTCPSLTVTGTMLAIGDLDQPQSGSVVQFRCSSDAEELVGPTRIVCGDNGKWDHEQPTECRAILCPKPQLNNFVVIGDKTEYKKDEVLRYRCDNKYRKVDGRPSMCIKVGESGQWSPPPRCELKTCKVDADRVDGTSYSPDNKLIFNPSENVIVTCTEKQWVMKREFRTAELTCLDTGEWNFSPVCKLITCKKEAENVTWWERDAAENAHWFGRTNYYSHTSNFDESVRYRCKTGYKETSYTATCRREGWEPNPLCKEKGCAIPSFTNADIANTPKEAYDHDDYVYFKCTYNPSVAFYMYCHYGEWTYYSQPTQPCREKPCTTEPDIENGKIHGDLKEEYEHNDKLMIKCDDETEFEVTCQSGEWNKPKICHDLSCPKPSIKNGHLLGPELERFNHNDQVEGRCTTGPQENFTMTCRSGEWTQVPLCPEKSACGDPAIDNGFSVEYENKLYYRCNAGYKLLSRGWWAVASCVDDKWNTSDCIADTDCGPLPHIPNMKSIDRKSYRDGENATILCKVGHHTALEALTCNKGKWDSNNVKLNQICRPTGENCNPPSAIENAVIIAPFKKEYLSNTTLTYKCRDQEGDNIIQCNEGNWQPDPKRISC